MQHHYQHTQFGTFLVSLFTFGIVLVLFLGMMTEWYPPLIAVLIILLVALALFASLSVEIREGTVHVRFGPGLIRKKIPLERIVDARPVRNRWYWGWGVRYTPQGWLFNVSGLDAVELLLTTGRRFRIGTDEPHKLAQAIQEARKRTQGIQKGR
ncbi:MAG: hypothetical protein ACOC0U_06480 [Desulfovibrionales bacterium]